VTDKARMKTAAEVVLDIGSALGFACRLALDYDLKRETLIELLDASYDVAVEIRSKSPAATSATPAAPRPGLKKSTPRAKKLKLRRS
jgi:hypothetical protein